MDTMIEPPSLFDIPSACIRDIAKFLPASSLVRFLSTCRSIHAHGDSSGFWQLLEKEQSLFSRPKNPPTSAEEAKKTFLLHAHVHPQVSSVRWLHVCPQVTMPAGREGHLGCRLGDCLLLTEGFSDDDRIYYKRIVDAGGWRVATRVQQTQQLSPSWVYGATLTPLDDRRAIRFGGFRGGGYTSAVAEVAVLDFTVDPKTGRNARGVWEVKTCYSATGEALQRDDPVWTAWAGRAYHSAVLLFDRYLLVMGGMQESGSILRPMLLDTRSWTWYTDNITVGAAAAPHAEVEPTGRHGASLVSDIEDRDRLLLFGGGSGTDLLRSGFDNAEVWELITNKCSADTVLQSLPWEWRCVMKEPPPDTFTVTQILPLGRCHISTRVGRNTILFAFGSGRPTCNGLLGYRTDNDTLFSLPNIEGARPCGRFTCAAIYLEESGYWVVHGGYTSRGTTNGICILDVAATLQRRTALHALDPRPVPYELVEAAPVPLDRNRMATVMRRYFGFSNLLYAEEASASDSSSEWDGE